MASKWESVFYGFYKTPEVEYVGTRVVHSFHCAARGCSHVVRWFLDTKDATSTKTLSRPTTCKVLLGR